eukprot:2598949-Pyramimonas_sp.AAC.1
MARDVSDTSSGALRPSRDLPGPLRSLQRSLGSSLRRVGVPANPGKPCAFLRGAQDSLGFPLDSSGVLEHRVAPVNPDMRQVRLSSWSCSVSIYQPILLALNKYR